MSMRRFSLWFAAGLAMTLTFGVADRAWAQGLKVGDPAPGFSLTGSDGQKHTLADFKGKQAVVIAWFPKAFTGGCTAECKSLKESGEALKGLNIAYFTASVDDAETNKKFAESLELDYPILSDPSKNIATAYGVVHPGRDLPERWTFYIDKDGKIAHVDKQVKTGTAGADLAAKVKELGLAGE